MQGQPFPVSVLGAKVTNAGAPGMDVNPTHRRPESDVRDRFRRGYWPSQRLTARHTLWPPKPKELVRARRTGLSTTWLCA
jgi:hypothetical protein